MKLFKLQLIHHRDHPDETFLLFIVEENERKARMLADSEMGSIDSAKWLNKELSSCEEINTNVPTLIYYQS